MLVDAASLVVWAAKVLECLGLASDDAEVVAENLAFSDLRGVSSHGFIRLETYANRIQAGGINPRPGMTTVRDEGALVVLDADDGPGAATAAVATDLAMERAAKFGIGAVITRRSNHFGAAAFFTSRMADRGFVGLAACNTDKVMCGPFGGKAVLGTNPIAVAVPVDHDVRPQLDMATSEASYGKLLVAARDGISIPEGWAVDAEGKPTRSPKDGIAGALLPSGGPKGFGLAFVVDALVALAGAATSPDVGELYGNPAAAQRLGHVFIAISTGSDHDAETYRDSIDRLVENVHGSALAESPVMFPGEPELNRQRDSRGLIEVAGPLAQSLDIVAGLAGIPPLELNDHTQKGTK